MNNIVLKKITLAEINELLTLSRQTFHETFAGLNSEKDMQKYLNENLSTGKLSLELNDPNSEFFFALLNNKALGYLKVNTGPAQTELKNDNALEIERIYVLKEAHGTGVGQSLYKRALELAREKQTDYVWLGVWEKNHRAISFYKKNGFVEFDKHVFKLGDDEQTDIMMKLIVQNTL